MTDIATSSPATEPAAKPAKRKATWWEEVKGIFWLLLVVLGFHSFVAKPFYIPSESMLPGLEVGDRLVVSKWAYGWSFVSPTIPNPIGIVRSVIGRDPTASWAVVLPPMEGRVFGRLPERGDIVIVTPPGTNTDYIKRVIGLPGETIEVKGGAVYLNGAPLKRGPLRYVELRDYGGTRGPDGREMCDAAEYGPDVQRRAPDGMVTCRLPVITETLPNGRRYDTVELGPSIGDDFPATRIPAGHVFLMGDNRDKSADSRFPLAAQGLGGPVPYENIGGRAEFITFSLDGTMTLNPLTWIPAFRAGRAGMSLHPEREPVAAAAR